MDTKELANSAVAAVKAYVSKKLEALETRIDDMANSLADLPKGDYASIEQVESIERSLKELKEKPFTPGPQGDPGKDAVVDMEQVKELVAQEVANLPPPNDGRDGLDALDIDILPAINDLKAYPRGVYATHNGGLWRSFKQTDGMDGWECIVDGVKDINIEYDGERSFTISTVKASGKVSEKSFDTPMVIDRGTFKDGAGYKKFDGVTFGGSFWIAQKDAPEGKPGGSDDFRLSVKRGRDGRETVKIEHSKPVKV